MVDCGELVVGCVVVKKCASDFGFLFGCCRRRQLPGALVPKATAKTRSYGLKGSSGCGEWNSSPSAALRVRMTAETCNGRCKCHGKCAVGLWDGLGRKAVSPLRCSR